MSVQVHRHVRRARLQGTTIQFEARRRRVRHLFVQGGRQIIKERPAMVKHRQRPAASNTTASIGGIKQAPLQDQKHHPSRRLAQSSAISKSKAAGKRESTGASYDRSNTSGADSMSAPPLPSRQSPRLSAVKASRSVGLRGGFGRHVPIHHSTLVHLTPIVAYIHLWPAWGVNVLYSPRSADL